MRALPDLSVYLVLDQGLCGAFGMVETARAAVAGGAGVVQLRLKSANTAERIALGRELQQALAGSGAALIVNDDVEAARVLGADGVHVGQGDLPAAQVRQAIGPDMILGLSAESVQAAQGADPALVDYLGVGPVFATPTKADHKPPIGFDGLAQVIKAAPLPAVAIGGIKADHAQPVFAAGAAGMAVVSAICGQPEPQEAARSISGNWARARQEIS
ncbi:MAG: thiamine phosphate synthase [Mangrovicoccus sp.]|nr:thiamine phosphate synthase [Mangrovicoccus sp.]